MATATLGRAVPEISEIEFRLACAEASKQPSPVPSIKTAEDKATVPVSQTWLKLVSADIKHLSEILAQLVELRRGPERDEYGVLRPTMHAFERAFSLLIDAAIDAAMHGGTVPYGSASTDSEGGIRIEWVSSSCSVHLVIPAKPEVRGYLYHEIGEEFGTTDSVTSDRLASWLRRFSTSH